LNVAVATVLEGDREVDEYIRQYSVVGIADMESRCNYDRPAIEERSCLHIGCIDGVDMVLLIEGSPIGDNHCWELVVENMGKRMRELGFDHIAP